MVLVITFAGFAYTDNKPKTKAEVKCAYNAYSEKLYCGPKVKHCDKDPYGNDACGGLVDYCKKGSYGDVIGGGNSKRCLSGEGRIECSEQRNRDEGYIVGVYSNDFP